EFAERAEPHLHAATQLEWLDRLEREHDNLRAALAWSLGEGRDVDAALRLAGALFRFWQYRGYLSEGRGWLEDALALDHEQTGRSARGRARAKALYCAAWLLMTQGDFATARTYLDECYRLARGAGDSSNLAYALVIDALVLLFAGDLAEAHTRT